MKKLYLIIAIILVILNAGAQEKLVESSARKAPQWIGMSGTDFFTVSVTANSLEQAQKKALQDIKQYILNAIASNIVSTETSVNQQINKNDVFDMMELYSSTLTTQGANMPFITDISLSNAQDIYWAKYVVKKENKTFYQYNVKYEFPENERKQLIKQFLKLDKDQYDKYLTLLAKLDSFTNIEDIQRAMEDLDVLVQYFFDQNRKNQVIALRNNYRKQYENITILPINVSPGQYDYCLMLSGRMVNTAKKATLKSNCASEMTCLTIDNFYRITYKDNDCRDDEENDIDIRYVLGGRTISHKFPIDVKLTKIQVIPVGNLSLIIRPYEDSLKQITVNFTLRSKYDNQFVVEQVYLSVPQIKDPIDSGNIQEAFSAKGNNNITFVIKTNAQIIDSPQAALTRGFIKIKNTATNTSLSIPLQLPYVINQ